MSDLLSNSSIAIQHSNDLKSSAEQLGTISSVAPGDTNHGVNSSCCSYYTDLSNILGTYSTAAHKDADRIKTIDEKFASVDNEMATEI